MRAVVIHDSLNTPGGETTVAIETIQSLADLGYDVELATVQKSDTEGTAKASGENSSIRKKMQQYMEHTRNISSVAIVI
jgi:hypothetical protein